MGLCRPHCEGQFDCRRLVTLGQLTVETQYGAEADVDGYEEELIMETREIDEPPVRNGRRVILVMLSIVTVLAGTALFLANKARSLKPARRVATHLKLQESAVELKIELDLLKTSVKTLPQKNDIILGQTKDATALATKAMAIAKRAARTIKLMPKMIKSVAAEARAMRNDPFSKTADKTAAGRRLNDMAKFEAETTQQFEGIRDEALRVFSYINRGSNTNKD
ncbi:MAG: hypothetical protein VYA30_03480 [Myxococcota bacterium]|nr:hypothetical protein [Myxococcota bacterium]